MLVEPVGTLRQEGTVMTHPEPFTTRRWNSWIKRGRTVVRAQSTTQFDLGDITLEMFAKQRHGDSLGVEEMLGEYADQIGVTKSRLLAYRHVAIAWPVDKRNPDYSFTVHEILASVQPPATRYRLINRPPETDPISGQRRWTTNQALRHVGRMPRHPVTQQERIDNVRDLVVEDSDAILAMKDILRRPAVVDAVFDDPACRHIVRQAARIHSAIVDPELEPAEPEWDPTEYAQEEAEPAPQAYAGSRVGGSYSGSATCRPSSGHRPTVEADEAPRETLQVLGACTSFYAQMQRIIPTLHVAEFSADQQHTMLASLERVRAAAEWAETVIQTGDTSMDAALAKLLGGTP
ncbi:DUF6192 family protein [Nocardia cyriacigeorgica]|uniref:DUF6192 family protein n=1 Tax=Nocardia cyriacigeorgica TaxID=135487 RepID=UPI00189430C9|nr:DUF6192 family protein [Nocardia cyriacigeorgica]MBF6412934.1 hypothetical protein [Nocardia cyriacigeorgica]